MKYLLMLAAAASLACAGNKTEDEVGAAPDQGRTDTTAVTATDTTAVPTDSTMGQQPGAADTSFVQQDSTAAPTGVDSTYTPSGNTPTDTLSQPSSETTPSDSTMGNMGQDSSGMSMPADSTAQPNQ